MHLVGLDGAEPAAFALLHSVARVHTEPEARDWVVTTNAAIVEPVLAASVFGRLRCPHDVVDRVLEFELHWVGCLAATGPTIANIMEVTLILGNQVFVAGIVNFSALLLADQ